MRRNLAWQLARRAYHRALGALPEELAIRLTHLKATGDPFLRLRHPRTFNEKVQHRKLYERDPRMPALVDKIEVKKFVAEKLGPGWTIPTLYAGPALPPREERNWPLPYVVKPSHRSGEIIFVRSPVGVDWPSIEEACEEWTSTLYATHAVEWAYAQLEPRILVEPCIGGDHPPIDYKFFVFASRAEYIEVDIDRHRDHRQAFFDREWRRQPFKRDFPAYEGEVTAPRPLDRMIAAAETLGAGWGFVRVDFYEVNGAAKFGELTFYPSSGTGRFHPPKWDRAFGELWPIETALTKGSVEG